MKHKVSESFHFYFRICKPVKCETILQGEGNDCGLEHILNSEKIYHIILSYL